MSCAGHLQKVRTFFLSLVYSKEAFVVYCKVSLGCVKLRPAAEASLCFVVRKGPKLFFSLILDI